MNVKTGYFTALVLMSLLVCAENAYACFGSSPSDKITGTREYNFFVKDFNRAQVIFSGKIIEMDQYRAKFKIDRIWKGDVSDEFVISTGNLPTINGSYITTTCDYTFKLGESYVVYAHRNHYDWLNTVSDLDESIKNFFPEVLPAYRKLLVTSLGSRTRPLPEAKQGIDNLNKLTKTKNKALQ